MMTIEKRDAAGIGAIVAAWIAAIVCVDPRGDFPLYDDWAYGVSVFDFDRLGHFHFPAVAVVSMRAQVLWGALWTRLFGQSFTVLRASTLFLSIATLIVIERILARAGAGVWVRLFGTLAMLFNPVFLWSSCSFMTEVPFVFAAAVGFYCFARGIQEERVAWMIGGGVAVMVACFVRQNGVMYLFPPLAVLALTRPRRWRALASVVIAFGAIFGAILVFKRDWLFSGSPKMFQVHYHMWLESSFRLPEQIATLFHYVCFSAIDSAIFFFPLALPLLAFRRTSRRARIVIAAIALLIGYRMAYLAWNGYWIPYGAKHEFSDVNPGPLFIDFGFGGVDLVDVVAGYHYPFILPMFGHVMLTIVVAALATLLVWALAVTRGNTTYELAVAAFVFGTLMLFASGFYYDRYSLDHAWAVVIALPLVIPWEKRLARTLAIVALIATALLSTLSVREHFSWQRARWQAYHDLRARGVAVNQIDGGGCVDGLYELRDATFSQTRRGHDLRPYVIAFNVLPGYRVNARYPFSGFFGTRRADVLVLQRSR